jgi:NAD(P)-dependent dehydrogenase (short-subunit alcohol dehydrogenase family)
MATVLITGSNRGLGLEWVRQCAVRGCRVVATCRDPDSAADLRWLASQYPGVSVHRRDVFAPDQIADLCVFRGKVDTDSTANWTPSPRQTGQGFQGKLDT